MSVYTHPQNPSAATAAPVIPFVTKPKTIWFTGLNALRFFAAATVVVMHIHNNMGVSGLPQLPELPVLFKGLSAVSFFFVLSGFLITYLLLQERQATQTISIRKFYLRRVFRIWPLYFLVVAIGALFYWQLVPAMHLKFENSYPHGLAILLYSFFLANLMNSLYHVGGILHITWSIAVEEQFYLFWAPLVKKLKHRIPQLIISVIVLSYTFNVLNALNVFGISKELQAFISTLQFHYMGIGGAFAWLLFYQKERLFNLAVFRNKTWQVILTIVLLSYFLFYTKSVTGDIITGLPLGLLFGWLIINVSSNPNKIFSLERPVLNYLGKISYGIYMFHMPVVYACSFLFQKVHFLTSNPLLYFPLFFALVFATTIAIASVSYKIIEQPILKAGKRFA